MDNMKNFIVQIEGVRRPATIQGLKIEPGAAVTSITAKGGETVFSIATARLVWIAEEKSIVGPESEG